MTQEFNDLLEISRQPSPETKPVVANTQYDQLQMASNYRLVTKTLRPAGIGSIVFGVIAIAMGFGSIEENQANAILGLIGLFLLAEGVWITFAPTPAGMIVDGIALIILGVWNIIITIANISATGGEGANFFAVMGVWQIIWGCQGFGRYSRLSKLPMSKPSGDTLKMIENIVKEVRKTKTKNASDIIEFQAKAFTAQQAWKGKLSQDSAVFVLASGQDVVFAGKDQVEIDKQGKVLIGKTLKAAFKLGQRSMNGMISPESFAKYEAWKGKEQ